MPGPALIETKEELRQNTIRFANDTAALATKKSAASEAIGNGCSHAVEWVGFQDNAGVWKVAFCKFAGYKDLTFNTYDQLRQTELTGTDTKRRVEKLGGTYYGVGSDSGLNATHPAVDAVRAICSQFGKVPKRTAKVRVFVADSRPASMDVLVAAIRAAKFTDGELQQLLEEVKGAAG